jgi:HAD superfamily hydrolase (TIGR01549 family)
MTTIKGVILDMDGTLIDSNEQHTQSWIDVLDEHGYDIPYSVIRPLIGKGGGELLKESVDVEGDAAQQIKNDRLDLFMDIYLSQINATSGTRDFVQRLKDAGLKVVIATSAGEEALKKFLKIANVGDLIDGVTSSDEVEESKPAPNVVEVAIKELGLPADAVVMVGDTPYDIEAGNRAGIPVVVVRCGGYWQDDDFDDAVAIYDDPAAILAVYDETIFAQ